LFTSETSDPLVSLQTADEEKIMDAFSRAVALAVAVVPYACCVLIAGAFSPKKPPLDNALLSFYNFKCGLAMNCSLPPSLQRRSLH